VLFYGLFVRSWSADCKASTRYPVRADFWPVHAVHHGGSCCFMACSCGHGQPIAKPLRAILFVLIFGLFMLCIMAVRAVDVGQAGLSQSLVCFS